MKLPVCLLLAPFVLAGCAALPPSAERMDAVAERPVWTASVRSESGKNSYYVTLQTPDRRMTGVCVVKKTGGEWRGTLVGEMGAKAFDFRITDRKCELLNVLPALDKWYVKKTVAADLYYLFQVDNPRSAFCGRLRRSVQDGCLTVCYRKKQLCVTTDGAVVLKNSRRNLRYELKKIETDADE